MCFPTGWPRPEETGFDGWSDGDSSGTSGAERELLRILDYIRERAVPNVVFISGDTHYPFALSYDPFKEGKPLCHEIGATPLHALCLPPPERGPDMSLNPTSLYSAGTFGGDLCNFGHIAISDAGELTMSLRDRKGEVLFSKALQPARGRA
jgi:alkaline phosphatase D